MDSNELAAEVGHAPLENGPLADFRAALQDQTDLLGIAQNKVRMLEARQKLKDEAHRGELVALQDIIKALEAQVVEVANGLGTVSADRYAKALEDLQKAQDKTRATRLYAEQQRALNVRWRQGAAAAMLAAGPLRDLLLETLPPAPKPKVIEGPSPTAPIGNTGSLALCSEPPTGVIG